MELTNLASQLDDDERKAIERLIYDDFEKDEESRQEWLSKHAEYLELYHQMDTPTDPPIQGGSEESIPLLTEAVNLFQARAYKAFFPSRNFVEAQPIERINQKIIESAERVGKHMSFQLTVLDRGYKPDKNSMFQAVALHGSDFTKAYYDPLKRKNRIERVRAEDFVVPYGNGPRRLNEIERKTHIVRKSVNETAMLAQMGWFESVALPDDGMGRDLSEMAEIQEAAEGLSQTMGRFDHPATILEQHRLLDLDGDGVAEPYIAWLDKTSKKLLRLQIRYDVDADGNAVNNKDPIEYFTHYGFLTNPDGFYCYGFGHLIAKLNKAVNSILRQTVNAGTLANLGNNTGIISESLGIKGDVIELELGKFMKAPRSVNDIRQGIFQLQFPGPNAAYVQTMQFLQGVAQRLGSTVDVVTGDVDKVMQPLTVITMQEGSLQLPTSIMEQLALSFEDELEKLYKLNAKYLGSDEFFIDGNDAVDVSPEDYAYNMRIVPVLDPRQITKQQKVAKSQQLFQFATANPVLNSNPQSMIEITRRTLEAMETDDIENIMPKPPKIERIDDQAAENMFFLLPKGDRPEFDVFPDQDHLSHIKKIDYFINYLTEQLPIDGNPMLASVDPAIDAQIKGISDEIKKQVITDLMIHRTKHIAYLYGMKEGVYGPRNDSGMDGFNGNAMVSAADTGLFPPGTGAIELPAGGGGPLPGTGGSVAGDTQSGGDGQIGILGVPGIIPRTN